MKKTTTRTTIIIVLLVMALVGYYAYLTNKSRSAKTDEVMTVVQSTLSRDLTKDYPPTPKEVIRYYNEIMRCLYNEECTSEEGEALGMKARELYDDELLEANEVGAYLIRLDAEVKDFKKKECRLGGISLAGSTNVVFFEEDGFSFAKIACGYNVVQSGSRYYNTEQMYLLRKDKEKRWKIYGWQDVKNLKEQTEQKME